MIELIQTYYPNILLIILAGLSGAWFECERLVASGKWKIPDYVKVPFWEGIKIKKINIKLDSYHLMFGICALSLLGIGFVSETILTAVISFMAFWYVRNNAMHWGFVNDNRYIYLIPIFGGMIEDLRKK